MQLEKRKRKKQDAFDKRVDLHHDESNWLVSYADMMTLLMGFFVLMYAFSRVDRNKFAVVRKEIATYFGGQVKALPAVEAASKEIKNFVKKMELEKEVQISTTETGIILRFNGELLFNSGSAELVPEMRPVLTRIITMIKAQKNVEEVRVEGHTDDIPIFSPVFPTNWELSAARAARVVRQFEAAGFPETKLVAEGYGASRPEVPNRTPNGDPIKENLAKNRRVIINVSFGHDVNEASMALDSTQFVRPREGQEEVIQSPQEEKEAHLSEEEQLKMRLEAAKRRLQVAQQKMREAQKIEREKAKKQALLKKVLELEKRAQEVETKAYQVLGDSQKRMPSQNPSKTLNLKEGLRELQKRQKQQK
ncbi:MAG: flagellar motor protein MotB [Bdellovibrio sp.]|nr:MAG: flagellar motor protein MotB [Bdellovibrio sp.]